MPPSGGVLGGLGLSTASHRGHRDTKMADLRRIQVVEQVAAHAVDVCRCGFLEACETRGHQDRQGDPAIVGRRFASDETRTHQPVEAAGQAAR